VVRIARYDPEAYVADIEVSVRDVWTLNPGISYSNTGDRSRTSFEIEGLNLVGRGQKLQIGWDDDVGSNTVEVYVHHLRRKLGADLIRTVRGVGYVIDALP